MSVSEAVGWDEAYRNRARLLGGLCDEPAKVRAIERAVKKFGI